jgi:hypothetical protein
MSIRPSQDRRRSQRIPTAFHVEVSGIDHHGIPYCDQAAATDVSESGCQIHVIREVRPGDVLTIRAIRQEGLADAYEKPFLFHAVWVETSKGGWIVGLHCLENGNPWRICFPQESLTGT